MPEATERREYVAALTDLGRATSDVGLRLHDLGESVRSNTVSVESMRLDLRTLNASLDARNSLERERQAIEREELALQRETLQRAAELDSERVKADVQMRETTDHGIQAEKDREHSIRKLAIEKASSWLEGKGGLMVIGAGVLIALQTMMGTGPLVELFRLVVQASAP